MVSTLFVYSGMHPAHKPFVDAIGADIFPAYVKNVTGLSKFISAFKMAEKYPEYDIYLLEGGSPMYPMYLRKKIFRKGGLVIGLLADETFINLVKRQPHYSFWETSIHRLSAKVLDAAISVSPMLKNFAEKVVDVPIIVVRPPIPAESFRKLKKIRPNLDSKVIVSVGQARFSIGMDILVDNFRIAKKIIPDLELWIVGRNHPKNYEKVSGVKVLGYIKDLSEIFSEASLFVHAGRCSAYPIATLEAMRAGLPVIVTEMTGTKEIVEEVELSIKNEFNLDYKNFKFIRNSNNIWRGIVDYFKLDSNIKYKFSKLYKQKSKEFSPGIRGREFEHGFKFILNKLGYNHE